MGQVGEPRSHRRKLSQQWLCRRFAVRALFTTVAVSLVVAAIDFHRRYYSNAPWSTEASLRAATIRRREDMTTPERDLPSILVVYTGPTSVINADLPLSAFQDQHVASKQLKYHFNFEYFLTYGIQCRTQDTLFVLGKDVAAYYSSRLQQLDTECQRQSQHRVLVTTRENKCLDLEAVRIAMYGGIVNVTAYDYFFYVNCGVSGPAKELANKPWTDFFLAKLNDQVKMTGLSHNCAFPHIQSMMYALDRKGLQIVMEGGAVFDCLERWPDFMNISMINRDVAHGKIVNGYEREMSTLINRNGFAFDPYLRSQVIFESNRSACVGNDLWLKSHLEEEFGRMPFLNETIFFKSTRYLSPELAAEIGYKGEIIGNWE